MASSHFRLENNLLCRRSRVGFERSELPSASKSPFTKHGHHGSRNTGIVEQRYTRVNHHHPRQGVVVLTGGIDLG